MILKNYGNIEINAGDIVSFEYIKNEFNVCIVETIDHNSGPDSNIKMKVKTIYFLKTGAKHTDSPRGHWWFARDVDSRGSVDFLGITNLVKLA